MATTNIYLPLNFTQLFELAKQLPKKQRQQLADMLLKEKEDATIEVSEAQKNFVRDSIKKHKAHPELLIPEKQAWKIIDAND